MDSNESEGELKNKTDFSDVLRDNTLEYSGEYREIIVHAPRIYGLLCKLLMSNKISKRYRTKICATIAYFQLPNDIFPEELFGAKGYIDDIYLSLHVLQDLMGEYGIAEIIEYRDGNPDILKRLLNKDYEKLDKRFRYILGKMFDYVGLTEFYSVQSPEDSD
jgi:uncharacterized membrane protein YkvA (DUF1232 family)